MSTEDLVHEPQTWADVEARALVEADLALSEHRAGEAVIEEREREGANESSPRRRR